MQKWTLLKWRTTAVEITRKNPLRAVGGGGVLGCKQRDLVSRQGKKYRRFKRAVIADMDEKNGLSPSILAQVLYLDLTASEASALLLALSVFPVSHIPPSWCLLSYGISTSTPPPFDGYPPLWYLTNWLLPFYQSQSESPPWLLLIYSPSSLEESVSIL